MLDEIVEAAARPGPEVAILPRVIGLEKAMAGVGLQRLTGLQGGAQLVLQLGPHEVVIVDVDHVHGVGDGKLAIAADDEPRL